MCCHGNRDHLGYLSSSEQFILSSLSAHKASWEVGEGCPLLCKDLVRRVKEGVGEVFGDSSQGSLVPKKSLLVTSLAKNL